MVKNSEGACEQCGKGSVALHHGLGCTSCSSDALGSCHCCNHDGTLGECPGNCDCTQGKLCQEYESNKQRKFWRA